MVGKDKIEWAQEWMPVLKVISKEFSKSKPFRNIKISMALHLEAKTAALAIALKQGGPRSELRDATPSAQTMRWQCH